MHITKFCLTPSQFSQTEALLLQSGAFQAHLFSYPGGVKAIRLTNQIIELILLPYQGQQIWRASILGRDLTMKSMFEHPNPTQNFLSTFGGFLLHCGATAFGSPGPHDHHPLHGELPNAPYQDAWIELGEDENGKFIELTGTYRHTVAFNCDYLAQPKTRLYQNASLFHVSMDLTNHKNSAFPYMYLAHINFLPVDNGHLVFSAPIDPDHFRIREIMPGHMAVSPEFEWFLKELKTKPEQHMFLKPEYVYDPEVVFYLQQVPDLSGWSRSMQIHPEGFADVVYHRPDQLDHSIVWICRTPDQQALGFEPATAEVEGFTAEREKGNLKWIQPGETFHCEFKVGSITP